MGDEMKSDSLRVAMLGDTGSGKTCFIAALQWLGETGTTFYNIGANGETKRYVDLLVEDFSKGVLPEGSPSTRHLSFTERYGREGRRSVNFDFEMCDYRGRDLHDVDDASPLLQNWASCDVLLIMIDVSMVANGGPELLENLRDLRNALNRPAMKAREKSLAVVLTQADKVGFSKERHSCEEARRYLDKNLRTFSRAIEEFGFRRWKCFALASLGVEPKKNEDGFKYIPLVDRRPAINPFGYEELFDWLSDIRPQVALKKTWAALLEKWRPFDRPVKIGIVVTGMIVALISVVLTYGWNAAKETATNEAESSDVRAKATWDMREEERIAEIENRIQEYERKLRSAGADAEVRNVLNDWKKYWGHAKLTENQKSRVDELSHEFMRKLETTLVDGIVQTVEAKNDAYAKALIVRYDADTLILRDHEKRIKELRDILLERERESARHDIAKFSVGSPDNTQRMMEIIRLVRMFVYPNDQERNDALRAAKAMENLIKCKLFHVEQIQVGTLREPRDIHVKIATGVQSGCDLKDNVEALDTTRKDDVTSAQWDAGEITNAEIAWTPGKTIRIEWRRNRTLGRDKMYAYYEAKSGDWLGLLRVLIPRCPMEHPPGHENIDGGPWMIIKCQEFDDPKKDLELIERYIQPGTYWGE